ncbi:hypothetical protein P167DRAFT_535407 [Morchella conica CCBAS932]|uniref:Uncharacterized protein n=1 Tax=Morchella conica CCBAS932 TaxID=1392247 RepID=A0A3N4KR78_9PEZI|nr:hypothetical protein P167DRAFT_535407 [Morchella conica CCBAS932]
MSPSRRPRDTSDLFPIQVMTSIEFKSILEHKSLPKKSKVEKKTSAAVKRAAAAAAAAATTSKEADSKADSPKQKARGRAPTKDKLAKEKKGPYNGYGWIWQDDFIEYLQRGRLLWPAPWVV